MKNLAVTSNEVIYRSLQSNLLSFSSVYPCDNSVKKCLDSLESHLSGDLPDHALIRCQFTTKRILDRAASNAETCPAEFTKKVWAAANYAEALVVAFQLPLNMTRLKECIDSIENNMELN